MSNCGFGHRGPYRDFKTWGPIVQACSGLTFSSGLPDQLPAGWGYSYMDHHGGNFMAIAILAALVHRSRTGEGQWVDMSCTAAGASLLGPVVLDYTVNGRPLAPARDAELQPQPVPGDGAPRDLPCAGEDEWVAIACRQMRTGGAWRVSSASRGSTMRRFEELGGRLAFEDELDESLARWTSTREKFAVAADLRGAGVPASAVPEARRAHRSRPWDIGLGTVADRRAHRDGPRSASTASLCTCRRPTGRSTPGRPVPR